MKIRKIIMMVAMLTMVGVASADNLLVSNVEMKAGETKQITIELNNPDNKYAGFQFDLVLPEGITIAKNNKNKFIAAIDEDRVDDHTLTVSDIGNNTYRFLAFSMTNAELYETSGPLVNLTLKADEKIASGVKTASIVEQVFTQVSGDQVKWDKIFFSITIPAAVVPEITAENKSREYGDDNPQFTFTASSELNGQPELTTTATKESPVGDYEIVVGRGTVVGDYTSKNGILTITKAPLTVKAESYTIKQGDALPEFAATYSGFKNGEDETVLTKKPTLSTSATSASVPGEYDILVSGAEAQNYSFTYEKGTLTITEADPVTHEIGEVFTAPTIEGVEMKFKVISNSEVIVYGDNSSPSIDKTYSESVTIPEMVDGYKVSGISDFAFYNCQSLSSVIIPNGVTSIGSYAFQFCYKLSAITIPKSVTIIGKYVFSYSYAISSMIVEEGNTVYDSRENCNAIIETSSNKLLFGCQSSVIPDGIVEIEGSAFSCCKNLKSITIPQSVTKIGYQAFISCTNLSSINVSSENAIFDSRDNCNAIIESSSNTLIVGCQSTTIPNTVTTIGIEAFWGSDNLRTIDIPESVATIDTRAFYGSGLISIDIPNNVKSIGEEAFSYCYSLTSVSVGNGMEEFGRRAFYECRKLNSFTVDVNVPLVLADATFYGVNMANAALYVPVGCVEAYQKADVWKDFGEIKEIGSVTHNIGDVFISPTVEGVDMKFKVISETEVEVYGGNGSSIDKKYAGSITIPEQVEGYHVTTIGTEAFKYCFGLTSVTIPNSVTSIDSNTFYGCYELTSATIPSSLKSIGGFAFYGCSNLTSITFPNSIETIGEYSFQGCSGLTTINIPKSVTTIGSGAFMWCNGVSSITVESGNATYDSRESCNAIIETNTNTMIAACQNTTIPTDVTTVGDFAFAGCTGLTYIEIPNNVTSIGIWAFEKCGLTNVILSENITGIGEGAFYGCEDLTHITIKVETPLVIDAIVFPNRFNATLYVPASCLEAYKAADVWKEFGEIIEINFTVDEMTPIEEETSIDTNGLGEEDLTNNVVDDVYYNVGDEGYDSGDNSVVIGQTTNMQQITDATPGSSDVSNLFTGLILKIGAGFGMITISAKTAGNASLAIQIGNGTPTIVQKTEKGDIKVPYNLAEDTYVYVYSTAANSSNARALLSLPSDFVKIYNIKIVPGATGIGTIDLNESSNKTWYTIDGKNLQAKPTKRGIYIVNGEKVIVK